jgi:hypothetical protein
MACNRVRSACGCLVALAACSAARVPPSLQALLRDSPENVPARLTIEQNRIVGAAVPIGPGELPPAVRTALEAVVPGGELTFRGREWGPRGAGFRVDKRYPDSGGGQVRSALVGADGTVLERSHSVPLAEVPQHVLAIGLATGPIVDDARIVSGPDHEEHWSLSVRDRQGHVSTVTVSLDGRRLATRRRLLGTVES